MLTLHLLRAQMSAHALSPQALSRLTPGTLDADRISLLCSKTDAKRPEPWLWEAHALAAALGTGDICTSLIGQRMEDIDIGEEMQDDIDLWNIGCELPLRLGIRIARVFGMSDPFDLFDLIKLRRRNPLLLETWSIVASGERTHGLVSQPIHPPCPWCREPISTGADHLSSCLPNNLWGTRALDPVEIMRGADLPDPHKPGKRQNGKGVRAPGLRSVRLRLRLTQAVMADMLGISYAHYTKVEACKAALTPEVTIRLRHHFPEVTRVDIYTAPTVVPLPPRKLAEPPVLIEG